MARVQCSGLVYWPSIPNVDVECAWHIDPVSLTAAQASGIESEYQRVIKGGDFIRLFHQVRGVPGLGSVVGLALGSWRTLLWLHGLP